MFIRELCSLPVENLMGICANLNADDAKASALINHLFYGVINSNHPFWKNKFKQHFPHLFEKTADYADRNPEQTNWYELFCHHYSAQYVTLSNDVRKIFSAIKEGHDENNAHLIEKSKKIDVLGNGERIPLTIEHVNMMRDSSNMTMLDWAITKQDQQMLDFIFSIAMNSADHKENKAQPLLKYAVLCNQPIEIISALLVSGADADYLYKTKNDSRSSALQLAAQYGHPNAATALLQHGATVDHKDRKHPMSLTPLQIATYQGHLDIMSTLLSAGANANAKCQHHECPTALHIAARYNDSKAINLLISHNADVNAVNHHGETALLVAQKYGHQAASQALGSDVKVSPTS